MLASRTHGTIEMRNVKPVAASAMWRRTMLVGQRQFRVKILEINADPAVVPRLRSRDPNARRCRALALRTESQDYKRVFEICVTRQRSTAPRI